MPMPAKWMPGPEVCEWLALKYLYNPETGRIHFRESGELADLHIAGNGYLLVRLTCTRLKVRSYASAHRLAWFLGSGEFPSLEIDHINHDKQDNRAENLRLATRTQNHRNGPKKVDRRGQGFSSKYRGVHWSKKDCRWMAQINTGNGTRHIGSFRNEADAARAYNTAATEHFGQFACLNQVA